MNKKPKVEDYEFAVECEPFFCKVREKWCRDKLVVMVAQSKQSAENKIKARYPNKAFRFIKILEPVLHSKPKHFKHTRRKVS